MPIQEGSTLAESQARSPECSGRSTRVNPKIRVQWWWFHQLETFCTYDGGVPPSDFAKHTAGYGLCSQGSIWLRSHFGLRGGQMDGKDKSSSLQCPHFSQSWSQITETAGEPSEGEGAIPTLCWGTPGLFHALGRTQLQDEHRALWCTWKENWHEAWGSHSPELLFFNIYFFKCYQSIWYVWGETLLVTVVVHFTV